MTTPTPREPWDDDRLGAAFLASAARTQTPADLVGVANAALRARTAAPPWARVLAAAAVVVLAVGIIAGGTALLGNQRGQADATAGPTARPTPSSSAVPTSPMDEPPISVTEALTVRAAGDGSELVVGGYLSPTPPIPCPFTPGDGNPTRIVCPQTFQWLMEDPESQITVGQDSSSGRPPTGPAFHPSFALVEPPEVPTAAQGATQPLPVVFIGHFHDRRASLCVAEPAPAVPCGDVFIVDRVAAVNGEPRGVLTLLQNQRYDEATKQEVTEQPRDLQEDVDRLALGVVPTGSILSRQLLTLDRVFDDEPVLAKDEFVPFVDNNGTLMWIVTVADLGGGARRARTFALMDGTNWFAELTRDGAVQLERKRSAPLPSGGGSPIATADPAAFDSAPTSVVGLAAQDVATVVQQRRTDGATDRDEYAIRAWYVGPNPDESCDSLDAAIHPPVPPCDGARHWLLDRPDQLASDPGQLRASPEQWPRILNPLIPVDVPFDVPATWSGSGVTAVPVIVVGHFNDTRVDAYHGNVYFVVDALAWTRDRASATDTVKRLTAGATEDPDAVLARVGAVSPNHAVATWATVVDATDVAALDPRAAQTAPEFTSGGPVWIVRRLIADGMDGRRRLAVEWALTADGGTRVWRTETPDSDLDLATTLDIHDIDPRTKLVRVFDYDRQIVSVRDVTPRDQLDWRYTAHKYMAVLEVARGRTDREVAIRWTSGSCDPEWRILVNTRWDAPGVYIQAQTFGDFCSGDRSRRSIILLFDHPVDLDSVLTTDEANPSGG